MKMLHNLLAVLMLGAMIAPAIEAGGYGNGRKGKTGQSAGKGKTRMCATKNGRNRMTHGKMQKSKLVRSS